MTRSVPQTGLKLISSEKWSFDGRVVVHRVASFATSTSAPVFWAVIFSLFFSKKSIATDEDDQTRGLPSTAPDGVSGFGVSVVSSVWLAPKRPLRGAILRTSSTRTCLLSRNRTSCQVHLDKIPMLGFLEAPKSCQLMRDPL